MLILGVAILSRLFRHGLAGKLLAGIDLDSL